MCGRFDRNRCNRRCVSMFVCHLFVANRAYNLTVNLVNVTARALSRASIFLVTRTLHCSNSTNVGVGLRTGMV
jgi:hypothetical protein